MVEGEIQATNTDCFVPIFRTDSHDQNVNGAERKSGRSGVSLIRENRKEH